MSPQHMPLGHFPRLCSPCPWAPPLPSWHTQGGEDVAKLGAHDRAVALLIKHAQPLHEVLVGALFLVAGDMLQDGQERLKVQRLGVHLLRRGQGRKGNST